MICGFFSAVGILTWTLAFNVDTGGTSIGEIVLDIATGGETSVVKQALCHHLPSVVIASAMKYWGPKNPFYVVLVVLSSIALFYIVLFLTGTSLVQAKEQGWFWSHEELVYYRSSEDANLVRGFANILVVDDNSRRYYPKKKRKKISLLCFNFFVFLFFVLSLFDQNTDWISGMGTARPLWCLESVAIRPLGGRLARLWNGSCLGILVHDSLFGTRDRLEEKRSQSRSYRTSGWW